jgi:hypothetical protein
MIREDLEKYACENETLKMKAELSGIFQRGIRHFPER